MTFDEALSQIPLSWIFQNLSHIPTSEFPWHASIHQPQMLGHGVGYGNTPADALLAAIRNRREFQVNDDNVGEFVPLSPEDLGL